MKHNYITVGDLFLEEVAIDVLLNSMVSDKPVYKMVKPQPKPVKKPVKKSERKPIRGFSDRFKEIIKSGKPNYIGTTKVAPVEEFVEVDTIEEVLAPVVNLVDELVEAPLNEVLGIEPVEITPVAEPVIDEVHAPKCTNIDLAISVINGSCTDMSEEDFDSEVWAIAVDCTKSKKELDFLLDRARTVESWKQEDSTSKASDYVYEDDEVNVVDKCDATILSFAKAFDCMSNKEEPAQKSRLDTLLDIIIENQEGYKVRYDKSYANLIGDYKSYKKCPNCHDLEDIGLEASDLSDKTLACALYKDLRHNSLYASDTFINKKLGKELFTRDDLLEILITGIDDYGVDQYIDFCGIEDDVRALTCAVA